MKFSRFFLLLSLLSSGFSVAATYYIDANKGNDSNSGKSEIKSWKTISKINSASFSAGDNILFKCGDVWREQLNIKFSGSKNAPVTIASYGNGNKPVISGAEILSDFQQHSGSTWKKPIKLPRQIFFDNARGIRKKSLSELKKEGDWYYDNTFIYILSFNPSSSYTSIEAAYRMNGISISGDNIAVRDIQIEKTFNDAVFISDKSENVILDNLEIVQWTDEVNSARAGAALMGKNCVIKNSVFGKKTENDLSGQNWAGYVAILISGRDNECFNNKIYHNSIENESSDGKYAYGIRLNNISGITKIHNNYIYHTASNSILADTYTRAGDEIRIFENEIAYAGQAGISAYKTRGSDGTGGKGFIYGNKISFANRLGGEKGSGGNRAAGIHFNDGLEKEVDPGKPFMKWYCYENTVHDSRSVNERNSPDSDGIAIDYNADAVEVFKNRIYNCDGKGIYIWNADNCQVYYNIVYGNDCGITVSASDNGYETANNNLIYNNVFYKNYNGNNRGKNYDTEIYFGLNGNYNIFINNILYASKNGTAYFFNSSNTKGCLIDFNIIYSETGTGGIIGADKFKNKKNFRDWKKDFPNWDKNSINADPQFKNADGFDFSLKPNSPAKNKGTSIGTPAEFTGIPVKENPDIGAFELRN
jgi:parallel beta-helix repeat protein